jgi:ABC-type antimicrobial peptide transport system permease subunit
MLKNYFTTAIRHLRKQPGFAVINLAGLALGIACSLLILLWVQDERGVDAFHANGQRLYYVYERNYMGGKLQTWYWTQGPLAEELKKEIPEVEASTPMSWPSTNNFAVDPQEPAGQKGRSGKVLKEDGFAAGPDYFSLFSYPLLEGNAKDALNSPDALAISRKMAVAFFGSPAAAIGKPIKYEDRKYFTVKAVFEDFTPAVSNQGNYVMSWSGYLGDNGWAKGWGAVDPRTVILLRPGADAAAVEKKISHFTDRFNTEVKDIRIELGLQRFSDYYLHDEFRDGIPSQGRIAYVRLFSLVALFILVIACINFMNLTTARSVRRAREIGVRKVMGAVRSRLIRQFLGEAIFLAVLAAVIALFLTSALLPAFNTLTGKAIAMPYYRVDFLLCMTAITLLTGLLSGSYPAFYLSGFNPIRVLKAALPSGTKGDAIFRQGLVVFQFALSIVLILSTILVTRQIDYMKNARIGYDRENLLYIPIEGELGKKLDVFRMEASALPGVQSISMLSSSPTVMNDGTLSLSWDGKDPNEHDRFIHEAIGPGYLQTMKIALVAGRDFDLAAYPTDSSGVIVNQTAVALMGYKDPIGKPVYNGRSRANIVGVVKDFHFQSLHNKIMPLVLEPGRNNWYSHVLVRTQPKQTTQALAGLQHLCSRLNPAFPFTYQFSDLEYARLYRSEDVTGRLSIVFAALAILISCLGLLGLSMFTAEQRVREIGIRKVLGASVGSLVGLLSKNFISLVGLAFLVGAPLGWLAMRQWLAGFAYQTNIPWWALPITGAVVATVALITVCWQTLRAAAASPMRTLRSE